MSHDLSLRFEGLIRRGVQKIRLMFLILLCPHIKFLAKYRAILNKIAAKILSNIENNKYKGIIQNLYQDLARV